MRGLFRKSHLNGSYYGEDSGMKVQEAEWKKYKSGGRFLMLKYKQDLGGDNVLRGYARKTLRNGYSIMVDWQAQNNRALKKADLNSLNAIMTSWVFTSALTMPITLSTSVSFNEVPPAETNSGKFTVSGTCDPGLRLIAVVMRMSSATPTVLETTPNAKGKFSFNVKLPEEGVWLMTVTAMNGDEEVGEYVMDTTTYQQSLLCNTFNDFGLDMESSLTQTISGDKLVISGTTIGQVTVQCLVDGPVAYSKQVKTNNSGKYSFSIDTSNEGDYHIVVVLSKKRYNTRRFAIDAVREITQKDIESRARESAIKPGYATLVKKISGYVGKTMVYNLYTVSTQQAGEEWMLVMAMNRTKAGKYSNLVYVTAKEDPGFSVDSQHTVYLTCTGMETITGEEDSVEYPAFDLIFTEK